MSVTIKLGVMGWEKLSRDCRKCAKRIHDQCYTPQKKDMVITSIAEGNHAIDSFHYVYKAFDFRKEDIPLIALRKAAGPDFDVIASKNGAVHAEHDPKQKP